MSDKQNIDGELNVAEIIAESSESGARRVHGFMYYFIAVIAAAWSIFQLIIPYYFINSDIARTIHLTFGIALVFLCCPAFKFFKRIKFPAFLTAVKYVPVVDIILAVLAVIAASYYAFDYVGIAERQGLPLNRDYVIGFALVILLLEAARRSLGPALPIIAVFFIVISFFGPELPGRIAFRRVSVDQVLGQLTMSGEGIYGLPLYVSTTMVFLFVLFGAMLNHCGGGKYFVQLAFSLLGGFKGGPAKAAVLASGMTGLISGSSIANTVTTGTFTIPLMKKSGYPAEKAAAVEVAASTNGQLMPPIMGAAAFIIAERCNIPYLSVVRAAFIPAIVSYFALIYISHLEACKLGLEGMAKEDIPPFWKTFLSGLHFLIPLGLLVFLLIRRYSPEMAAFWGIIALTVVILFAEPIRAYLNEEKISKGLKKGGLIIWESLVSGGRNMMSISVAVAAAGIIVGMMTLGLGSMVTEAIIFIARDNLVLTLVIAAVASLILGMGLPTTANYIVVSTLIAPALLLMAGQYKLAIPLIAAHLFCFFFGILADDTPPVGLAAYAASAIAKSNPIKTGLQGFFYDIRTALLPFMFFFNTDLLLIGIHSIWKILLIFVAAVFGMFAFSSLTQNYFITKNRWYDSVPLILVACFLLNPNFPQAIVQLPNKYLWYLVGGLIYGVIFVHQTYRSKQTKC